MGRDVYKSPCEWEALRRKLDTAASLAGTDCPLCVRIDAAFKEQNVENVFDNDRKIKVFLENKQIEIIGNIDGIIRRLTEKKGGKTIGPPRGAQ